MIPARVPLTESSTGLDVVNAGIIEEARRRQRRRRARFAAAAAAASAMAAMTLVIAASMVSNASHGPSAPRSKSIPFVAPGRVLAQAPYMGVACPIPNSIVCDRVGLAIVLRRPAVSVNATIAGWPVALSYFGDFPAPRGARPRKQFDGFLQPAGIVSHLHVTPDGPNYNAPGYWTGDVHNWPPPALVGLRIDYGHGRTVGTRLKVDLSTGWG